MDGLIVKVFSLNGKRCKGHTAADIEVLDEILEAHSVHDLSISIYPNPSTDIIKINGEKEEDSHFQIISTAGLEVEHGNVPEEGIPVSNLSSGMYILVIDSSKGISTTKFYKD